MQDNDIRKKFGNANVDFNFSGDEYNPLWTRGDNQFYRSHLATGLENKFDTRTAVAADFDGDGDLDVVERILQKPHVVFFENQLDNKFGWVSIVLKQPGLNPQAIGAKLVLTCDANVQTRQITAGDSYLGQRPYRVFFGLGTCPSPPQLSIRWPNGKVSEHTLKAINQAHTVSRPH